MRLVRVRYAVAALVALQVSSTGCAAWRQVEVAPTALATEPQEVRITHPDGTRLVLYDPRIANDTLYGTMKEGKYAIALADVRRMAVPSASRSEVAAGTTFVGVAVGVFLISWFILAAED